MKGHRAGIYLHHTEWLQGGEPQRFNSSRGVNPASAGKTLVLCVSHTQKHAHTDKQTNVGRRINTNTTVITTWQHVMDWPSDRNTTAAEQTFELVKEWTKRAEVWSLIKTNLQMCQIHTHTHTTASSDQSFNTTGWMWATVGKCPSKILQDGFNRYNIMKSWPEFVHFFPQL